MGKDPSSFDGYRPIYLLAAIFKLYDKLLFNRINKHVSKASEPWQSGGSRGADQAAWMLNEVLWARRRQGIGNKTWVAFLDAEAAYCRPPKPSILKGLHRAGVSWDDWLAVRSVLAELRGCVKLNGKVYGDWSIECGAPQGGSLSSPLFKSVLPELVQELTEAKCGIWVERPGGAPTFIACLGYVDDLALLASSAKMLQRALRIACKWARKVRIRWNVGAGKSAVMLWGRGKSSAKDSAEVLKVGELTLPRVDTYKYLGTTISNGGGWTANIAALRVKCTSRTREVLAWSNYRNCPATLSERLWRIYVEPAIIHGIGVMRLSQRQIDALVTCQRKAGRAILNFVPRSPTPAVFLELGWSSWRVAYTLQAARLLSRVVQSKNEISQCIVEASSAHTNTWAHAASDHVAHLMPDPNHADNKDWICALKEALIEQDTNDLLQEARTHHNLGSYQPTWWVQSGKPGINSTLYHCGLKGMVEPVRRLIIGGQGLRGGDPEDMPAVNQSNCCPACLENGDKVVESLQHVTFHCPTYHGSRMAVAHLLNVRSTIETFTLCRNLWTWSEIRALSRHFANVLRRRDELYASGAQALVDALWKR